jgi:uncharacterized protein (DUF2236 family)
MLRRAIGGRVRALVGAGEVDLVRPADDHGLFGPGSVTWTVHGDFTAMMIGGVSSLLMQMLHPGAMAGVWDHSDFRRDMTGRLKRTAQFVSVTTFGSTAAAERAIGQVRRIHAHVRGTLPDGTSYTADDPALLTWVHAAMVYGFLRAHLRYRDPTMPGARQDAYCAEMAELARRLGTTDVPESRAALDRYMAAMQPLLRADERTREVVGRMLRQPSPSLLNAPANRLMLHAGVDLLPDWAIRLHNLQRSLAERVGVRAGAMGVGGLLRWALR